MTAISMAHGAQLALTKVAIKLSSASYVTHTALLSSKAAILVI